MQVLKAKINWMLGWANPPVLCILVDKIPSPDELIYEQKDYGYFAELGGYVRFYYYKEPGTGYGGARFILNMKDGGTKELIGPWSSNAEYMRLIGFTHSFSISITDNLQNWERSAFSTGHITVKLANEVVKSLGVEIVYSTSKQQTFSELPNLQAPIMLGDTIVPGYIIADKEKALNKHIKEVGTNINPKCCNWCFNEFNSIKTS